jgi:NADPH:quinone reductase-like Zn-dependent oxidoreductase
MRQVWISRIGGPEVLEVREGPDPSPGPGQVRIRVRAAGVNFADTVARIGFYPDAPKPPCVVGYEVAGTIDAVGEGVPAARVGEPVLSLTRFGGYSDLLCVPARSALPFPARLSFAEAASIPVVWLTAWHMLVGLGNLRRGQRVLVHAAAGGVGTAAIQIARRIGAEVIGTASQGKHARLRELGLTHAVDYRNQDFEGEVKRLTGGRGVHLALDAVGGSSFRKSYRCLAPTGMLMVFGASSVSPGEQRSVVSALRMLATSPFFLPLSLMDDNKGVLGVNIGHLWKEEELLGGYLVDILRGFEAGDFRAIVDCEVPFAEAPRAHRRLAARENFGKVLLVP